MNYFYLWILALFTLSCTPHFYKPKPLDPALLNEKNQLTGNATTDFNMSSISIAYSPLKHLGIELGAATSNYVSSGKVGNRDTVYLKENYFNPYISVGYYKKISQDLLFETYGGAGIYQYKNAAISYLKEMKSINLFLQPSVAYIQKNDEIAFTLRVDYFNRNKTVLADSILSQNDLGKYEFLNYKNYFFVQPGVTVKVGLKKVKLQFQISENIPFSSNYKSIYGYGYQFLIFNSFSDKNRLLFSTGISIELDNLIKNKK